MPSIFLMSYSSYGIKLLHRHQNCVLGTASQDRRKNVVSLALAYRMMHWTILGFLFKFTLYLDIGKCRKCALPLHFLVHYIGNFVCLSLMFCHLCQ